MDDFSRFRQEIKACGLSIPEDTLTRFIRYADLIRDWNRRMNLVSRQDVDRILSRHVFDSLCLLSTVSIPSRDRVLDLGSGAGFPGIPMALVRPDLHIILVESKRKKVLFLQKALSELSLSNTTVILGRIEEIVATLPTVDVVVSRAVADLATLIGWICPLFSSGRGRLLAIKGPEAEEEICRMMDEGKFSAVESHQITPIYPAAFGKIHGNSVVVEIRFRKTDKTI
jgi:16S rRNA (guanine527-N7)-methyltransferase